MAKGNNIGNIANRSLVDVSRKSPGADLDKLSNTAKRADTTTAGKSPDKFGKIGMNTQKAVTTKGLDHRGKGI